MTNHHAIIVPGTTLGAVEALLPVVINDIDTDIVTEATLSIATVRTLIARAQQRPVSAPVRSFIIETNQIPIIAQNALLKLFEDPPVHVRFVVVMPRPDELIATLRSRVMIVSVANDAIPAAGTTPALLSQPVASQLATVEGWVKEGEQSAIDAFLTTTEAWLSSLAPEVQRQFLPTYLDVAAKLRQPGASKKMLLEHLVLSLRAR
jgi:hypothetical protein